MSDERDSVRGYLARRQCADHVVEGGLEGLVAGWEAFVREVEAGYALDLDEYLNDLDQRQLIADAWPHTARGQRAVFRRRIIAADERLRAATVPHGGCVWGPTVAKRYGLDPERHWWAFVRPREANGELLQELA